MEVLMKNGGVRQLDQRQSRKQRGEYGGDPERTAFPRAGSACLAPAVGYLYAAAECAGLWLMHLMAPRLVHIRLTSPVMDNEPGGASRQ